MSETKRPYDDHAATDINAEAKRLKSDTNVAGMAVVAQFVLQFR